MELANPLFPPPPGRMWHLHLNVPIYQGDGTISLCPLPEGNDAEGIWHENFKGRATWEATGNWGFEGAPDSSMYELGRWINAIFRVYSDGALVATMAIEPGNSAASPVLNILEQDVFRSYAAPPALWPEKLTYTTTSHSHPVDSGTIGIELIGWYGDVWVAEPACDSYECLLGGGEEPTGCPPPCENSTTGNLNKLKDELAESITVGWARTLERIDNRLFELGKTGELTWPEQWDDAKRFILDGFNYTAKAQGQSGFVDECQYLWIKPALTDAAGNPLFATTNVTVTGDTEHLTLPD